MWLQQLPTAQVTALGRCEGVVVLMLLQVLA